KAAITLLEKQRLLKPTSQVININLANTYIENNQASKAIPILEDMIFLDRQNQLPLLLLSDAYRKSGNKAMEHYVKAESMALAADYDGAIDQLNFAYRLSESDPLQLARIEARIRQFKQSKRAIEQL
ncbi:tetratricopeptide repeat protein, partial [Shewanella colwelliana]|uniref:tetratricopeptide repeat protein n=1 Tax=Shewanella colwelliana TaxID=23 RepID=UPI0039E0E94E